MPRIWKSNPPSVTLNALNGRDIPDEYNVARPPLTTSSQGSFYNMPRSSSVPFENPVDGYRRHIDTDLDSSSQASLNQMLRSLDVLVEDPVDPYYTNRNGTRSQAGGNEQRTVGAAAYSSTHLRRQDTLLANGQWNTSSSTHPGHQGTVPNNGQWTTSSSTHFRRQDTVSNNGPWTGSSSTRLRRQDTLTNNGPWGVGGATSSSTYTTREGTPYNGSSSPPSPTLSSASTDDDQAPCVDFCTACLCHRCSKR